MLRMAFSLVFGILWTVSALAKEGTTVQEMIKALERAGQTEGVQVGLFIDTHASATSRPYAEVVTLVKAAPTAFDALEAAKVTKVYHPQYRKPPNVLIYSLLGAGPDESSLGRRSWAFFVAKGLENVRWILSDKGVAQTPVGDGSLIGFSRTAWVRQGNGYTVHAHPRLDLAK